MVTFFRFADGLRRYDRSVMLVLPFNSLRMPETSSKGVSASRGGVTISFEVENGRRVLSCKTTAGKNAVPGGGPDVPPVEARIVLEQKHDTSLVMATPFREYLQAFYYNDKINCMPASGFIGIGGERFEFEPRTAFGLLDWGRGVWPFHTEWYWGNGSGLVDGVPFGFNIGYGFGDTSAATENMLFHNGEAHKIGEVMFDLSAGGYMSPKHFSSDDGSFEMDFTPIYDRYTQNKALFVDTSCHQVFGSFSGTVRLNNGRELEIRNLTAFTEHAVNNW